MQTVFFIYLCISMLLLVLHLLIALLCIRFVICKQKLIFRNIGRWKIGCVIAFIILHCSVLHDMLVVLFHLRGVVISIHPVEYI